MSVQFKSKDILVGVGLPTKSAYRLGLRSCSNRPSIIFQINRDGTDFKILYGASAQSNSREVRTTTNGDVFWFSRDLYEKLHPGPHLTELNLMGIVGGSDPEIIVKSSDAKFFDQVAPKRISLNDDTLILNTIVDGMTLCPSIVHVKEKCIELMENARNISVLDSQYGFVVGIKCSPIEPWSLVSAKASERVFKPLINHDGSLPERIYKPLYLKAHGGNKLPFNAIFVGPSPSGDDKTPLIVIPHGGPHCVKSSSYSQMLNFFIELGFSVLLVNYRGSLGYGDESVHGLLGNVGKDDVEDCIQALQECLKTNSHLNDKEIFLWGASHGGFLVTHLAGQYPELFTAIVALNPVINIASMASATDIPDWCFNESGFPFHYNTPLTPDIAKIMWEKSPISHIKNVKAPIHLLIGKEDLRVPPSQGYEYYKALKGLNKEVTMSVFPDNHSLGKPLIYANWMIKTGLFFLERLKSK
ncbi:acylamino-acid-releasing enzyme [Lepeophtheirus salmonis]|uniref:acylamino-acid-releasing enzyme n=1 Tax=Lepeophtheirus salmonis TaxID=72036 RepID=UPI001AEACA24|nr:acylamino-acid-releasing enzyme-like [Lepeophtheirus salmonis]XP_040581998.1 acylamino-acid-releasing enzyme-like [Lepeophtheirus salmonis]XP_040581999.1 acylamino-acid-releasing enzyme-like [Lepeophtheirus salmonis]